MKRTAAIQKEARQLAGIFRAQRLQLVEIEIKVARAFVSIAGRTRDEGTRSRNLLKAYRAYEAATRLTAILGELDRAHFKPILIRLKMELRAHSEDQPGTHRA